MPATSSRYAGPDAIGGNDQICLDSDNLLLLFFLAGCL
jgi:hypothetical protein